jgi:hypothetical protein
MSDGPPPDESALVISRRTVRRVGAGLVILLVAGGGFIVGRVTAPGSTHRVAVTATSTTTTVSTTAPTTTATPTTPTTAVPTTASPTTSAPVPTLGQSSGGSGPNRKGYGEVRPTTFSLGGADPTGTVTNIVWSSWGSSTATGTGTSWYVAPNQITAQGTSARATIVAYQLGTCQGKSMYQAVQWFFPQYGQSFDPNSGTNVCTGV